MGKKSFMKKALVYVMTFMMVFTSLPASVFAVDANNDDDMKIQQKVEAQIGDHYDVNQENGEKQTTVGGNKVIEKGKDTFEVDQQNWNVMVDKRIEPGTNAANEFVENLFKITLEVKTKTKIAEIAQPVDSAVVLVFDLSSSMKYDLGDTDERRVDAAKESAQEFLELYANTSGGERKIAIVGFHGTGNIIDANGDKLDSTTGKVEDGWHDARAIVGTDSDNDGLCNAIDNVDDGTGTNLESGLLLARNLLESSSLANIEYKHVILLSDGQPNRYVASSSVSNKNAVTYSGSSNNSHESHQGPIDAVNYIMKTLKVDVDTIFCGSTDEDVSSCNTAGCKYKSLDTTEYLKYFSTTGEIIEAYDADTLAEAFEDIAEKIEVATQAWHGSDPMSSNSQLTGITSNTNTNEVEWTEGKLDWNLYNSTPVETTLDNGTKIYTYSVEYNVKLNTLRDTFDKDTYYAANDPTKLDYFINTVDASGNVVKGEDQTIWFNIPTIQGYEGGYYQLMKVDENNEGLGGATFKLIHTCKTCTNCPDHVDCDADTLEECSYYWDMKAISDEDGYVTFRNIPSGHKYALKETEPPKDYQSKRETHELEVAFGKVYVDGVENKNLTVTNKLITYVDVEAKKFWNDAGNTDKRPNSITFDLYGTFEKDGVTYYIDENYEPKTAETVFASKTVNSTDNASYKWEKIHEKYDDYIINWFVEEQDVDGYTSSVEKEVNESGERPLISYEIENIYIPITETTFSYVGTKNWVGDGEDIRPENLTVKLQKLVNGNWVDTGKTPTWVEKDGSSWVFMFTGLPKTENGEAIQYKAVETVPNGYTDTSEVVGSTYEKVLAVNPITDLEGSNNNYNNNDTEFDIENDGIGIVMGRVSDKNNSNYWIWTSTDEELTAEEKALVNKIATARWGNFKENRCTYTFGSSAQYGNNNSNNRVTVNNTNGDVNVNFYSSDVWYRWAYGTVYLYEGNFTPGTTTLINTMTEDVTVEKEWADENNKYSSRPESVVVKLTGTTGSGDSAQVVVTKEATLNSSNGWTYTWNDLPAYNDGADIVYTVEEKTDVAGYSSETVKNNSGDYVITNTLKEETKIKNNHVTVYKVDQDKQALAGATFGIYDNAEGVGDAITTFTANGEDAYFEINTNNSALKEYLPSGDDATVTLYLKEISTPSGYELSTEILPVVIKSNVEADFDEEKDVYVTTTTYDIEIDGANKATVENEKITKEEVVNNSIKVIKTDGKDVLNGATFALYSGNNKVNEYTGGEFSISTDDVELANYLPQAGESVTLKLKETAAPNGYNKSTKEYEIVISASANEKLIDGIYVTTTTYDIEIDGANKATVENEKITKEEVVNDEITVSKTDGKDTLNGATFALYSGNNKVDEYTGGEFNIGTDDVALANYLPQPGESVTLKLKETAAPIGYVKSDDEYDVVISATANEALTNGVFVTTTTYTITINGAKDIEVVNTLELTSISCKKIWDDHKNKDNTRPENVVINLYGSYEVNSGNTTTKYFVKSDMSVTEEETVYETKEVTGTGETWVFTFDNLPKYIDGNEVNWTLSEEDILDESGKLLYSNVIEGYDITNTYPAVVNIPVKKIWNDANDQDGLRPGAIEVELYISNTNGKPIATLELNESNNWAGIFEALDKYDDNDEEIDYVVKEIVSDSVKKAYTTAIRESLSEGFTITNTHKPAVTSATIKKVWNDADDQDGKRPTELKVTLSNGTEVTLNEGNKWTATVENLPKFENGEEIDYTWTESSVDGYKLTDTKVDGTITILTNTHEPEVTSIEGSKIWEDNDNQDGIRPPSTTVELYGTYVAATDEGNKTYYVKSDLTSSTEKTVYATETVDANGLFNDWKYEFENLPVYVDGHKITWALSDEVAGYVSEQDGTNLVNTHVPELTTATVIKVWDDADNQDGIRPLELEVTLSNGTAVTLNSGNDWTATVTNLPKYKKGELIEYTWTEGKLTDGYKLVSTSKVGTVTTLSNKHIPETTEATIKKVWDDYDNRDGKRPTELTVTLSNGTKVKLDEGNDWTATVKDLPKYENGVEINYTWTEETLQNGYTVTGTTKEGTVTTLTNTYKAAETEATVVKVWDDGENQDNIRPNKLDVKLMNGDKEVAKVELNAENDWTATVKNLPVNSAGKQIVYEWVEDGQINGYTLSSTVANGTITTLTNKHTPAVTSATIKKVWDDAGDQDGIRPGSITATLSNGTTVTLNAGNNWTATVENLPKYDAGNEIPYTWEEPSVEGYKLTDTSVDGKVTTLTNTHTPATTEVKVVKVWDDANNQDGIRPTSIKVQLYADNEAYGEAVTLNAAKNWTHTWNGLADKKAGKDISYTVKEVDQPENYKYTSTVTGDAEAGYTITNSYTPETTEATIVKEWNDSNNKDGNRPVELDVYLKQSGNVIETVTLNEDNEWTATVKNLPKYNAGKLIAYTWEEETLPENYAFEKAEYDETTNITTITNLYPVYETTEVTVKKVWDDADNQDGKRPIDLTVTLSNGQLVTLNAGNNWTATVKDLPKYQDNTVKEEIVYTWSESKLPEGYELTDINVDGKITTLTNTHVPEKTSATIKKIWDDAGDQDGKRPTDLTVTLSNGTSVTLNEGNNWTAIVKDLPKYENGKEIAYTWEEPTVEGYKLTDKSTDGKITALTNTHVPEKTSATIKKVWDDADDQDGKRPTELIVTLSNGMSVKLSEGNDWTATVENLPKYENGKEITYTWKEPNVEGYKLTDKSTDGEVTTLTNSHVPEETEITVTKVWKDNDDQDGIRPNSVIVNLLANGEVIKTEELKTGNGWSYTWSNLDKYADGKEIVYAVTEEKVDGYTSKRSGNVDEGYILTNTHTPETVSVPVTKVWSDGNNQDGIRTKSVTVNLLADGNNIKSVELNAENNWSHTWENLNKYTDGKEIVYTVTENEVDGYKTEITGNLKTGFTVKNTHKPEVTEATITKVWDDADNQDGIRPPELKATLSNGAVVKLNESNGWTVTVKDLPKYENGKEIKYTWSEVKVDGYTLKDTVVRGTATTLINSHVPEVTSIEVSKKWQDADNQDGVRPGSVKVQLYAGTEKYGDEVTLSKTNNWTYKWTDLAVFAFGEKIEYEVKEVNAPSEYSWALSGKAETGLVITNSYPVKTVDVNVVKEWDDRNDEDNKRPKRVEVQLLANGEAYGEKIVLNDSKEWKHTWEDLDAYEEGKLIEYTIKEFEVDQYAYSSEVKAVKDNAGNTVGYNIALTNIYPIPKTEVSVGKVWEDGNDQDGIRAKSINVQLLANGKEVGDAVILSEDNNWNYVWEDLNVYEDGQKIKYSVRELDVPDGYKSEITGNAADGFVITNTHQVEKTEIAVEKTWADKGNQDGIRPNSIEVQLFANGEKFGNEVTLGKDNNWAYTWEDLDKYLDGEEIEYVVEEASVPEGYKTSVVGNAEEGFVITNTHQPEETNISVEKIWKDKNNQDGLRTDSVRVQLYAGKTPVGTHITLSDLNSWKYTWTGLNKFENGDAIEYTVKELDSVEGYTSKVTGDAQNGFTITNTHDIIKTSKIVKKEWADKGDQDGIRPNSIEVQLYADGQLKGDSVVLNKANGWTYTWENLDKYADGTEVTYTVNEVNVPEGYNKFVEGMTIINTHEVEKVSKTFNKVWNDANNQDGKRPTSILVQLYADGVKHGESVTVTSGNDWKHTWEDLDKYAKGKEVKYTVDEIAVPDGYSKSVDGMTITNTYTPETIDITGSKTWDDADNQDGIRPNKITVRLLANGTETDSVTVTAADDWAWTFTNLPKYDAGEKITYTVTEDAVENYSTTIDGYDITNNYVPGKTSVTVTKAWDDKNNQDGKRSKSIEVQLYADGDALGATVSLSEENNWTYTWEDLNMRKTGKDIVYIVKETVGADGYTSAITGNQTEGYIITNSYEPETTNLTVYKKWDDKRDKYDKRPETITVHLIANDMVWNTVQITADDNWHYTFEDMPVYANGEKVVYRVAEEPVDGYITEIEGLVITNTIDPDEIDPAADTGDDFEPWKVGLIALLAAIAAAGTALGRRRED